MIRGDIVDAKVSTALSRGPLTQRELETTCGLDRNRVAASVRRLMRLRELRREPVPVKYGNTTYRYQLVDLAETTNHDENEAFAEAPRGHGARRAANKLVSILTTRPRMLVMDDDGRLYAVDPNGGRAAVVLERHLDWIVGTYGPGCDVARIALDIRKQACAMSVEA